MTTVTLRAANTERPGFARGASISDDGEEERERETAKLYAKIGQLMVERDCLAGRPGR